MSHLIQALTLIMFLSCSEGATTPSSTILQTSDLNTQEKLNRIDNDTRVINTRDETVINLQIDKAKYKLSQCLNKTDFSGTNVVLYFNIEPTGIISNIGTIPYFSSTPIHQCINLSLQLMNFPAYEGPTVRIRKEIKIK